MNPELKKSENLNWQSFVQKAIKRRKEQKLTQEQLAVLAGVSKPTLNSFEQGKTTIRLDSARQARLRVAIDLYLVLGGGWMPDYRH